MAESPEGTPRNLDNHSRTADSLLIEKKQPPAAPTAKLDLENWILTNASKRCGHVVARRPYCGHKTFLHVLSAL